MTYDVNPSENIVAELSYLHDVTKPYDNVLAIFGANVDEKNRQYTYGLEMLSEDTTRQEGSANRLYYLHDELGSPIKLVDEAGLVGAKFEYDEFGRPIKPNDVKNWDKKGNVFSFTGYQLDASTGLMYAQARYYMPEVGRYISEDGYKGTILDPQSLNLYGYVTNNPINYIDPTGNMKWSQTDDLVLGIKDSVGETIENLTSWETYQGLWQLGVAIYKGDLSASELISSIAQSAIEPVTYVWNNADDVFLEDPCDEEVRTYGKKTGDVLQAVAGSSAAIKAVVKVAPKLEKLLTSFQKGAGNAGFGIRATQPLLEGTNIPKSFVLNGMKVGENELWVHPNATKHMAEFVNSAANRTGHATLVEREMMASFQSAVDQAIPLLTSGRNSITVGGWELGIDAGTGVIYHALMK